MGGGGGQGSSTMFETKPCYCCVAWHSLLCYMAVARLGFKGHAKVKFNSINVGRHETSMMFETGQANEN